MLQQHLDPWHRAIADPASAQTATLHRMLADYAKTRDGREHHAGTIETLEDYRQAYPIRTYEDFKPILEQVMRGDTEALLWEHPVGWAITRGTTKGESKFIPMTPTDLRMRVSAGRAVMQYVASTRRFDVVRGINLNFPSQVGTVTMGDQEVAYGYSSDIYTKYVSEKNPLRRVAPALRRQRGDSDVDTMLLYASLMDSRDADA